MSLDNTYKDLLQKLAAGTITDAERWTLQRASLDDPFLADALEGYALQKTEKDDLVGLRNKLNRSEKIVPVRKLVWRRLSIAATLLALFSVSFWMFQQNERDASLSVENSMKTVSGESNPETADLNEDISDVGKYDAVSSESRKEHSYTEQTKSDPIPAGQTASESISDWAQNKAASNSTKEIKPQSTATPTAPPMPTTARKQETVHEPVVSKSADRVVFNKADLEEQEILEEDMRRGNSEKRKAARDVTVFKKKESRPQPKREERVEKETDDEAIMGEIVVMDMPVVISQSNAGPIERLPQIIQGQIVGADGEPLQGVDILDIEKNKIASTDASGNFILPDMNGYVMTAFAGYDSATVAVSPQLSIALQPSSKTLSEPLKRAVDMMDDQQLSQQYTNDLNRLFSQNWPLCNRQQAANNPFSSISSTTVVLAVDDNGGLFDITFMSELSDDCKSAIEDVLKEALDKKVFATRRPISFRYRINL